MYQIITHRNDNQIDVHKCLFELDERFIRKNIIDIIDNHIVFDFYNNEFDDFIINKNCGYYY